MKHLSLVLTVALLAACSSQPAIKQANNQPAKLSACATAQPITQDGVYTSLVRANSQEESLRIALGNIANQIQVTIRSESESLSSKKNGVSEQSFQRRITGVSDFIFDDYEIVCQDFVTNEVLVAYDDRVLVERIRAKLHQYHSQTGWVLTGSPSLLASTGLSSLIGAPGISPASLSVEVTRNKKGRVLWLAQHRIQLRSEEWRQLYTLLFNGWTEFFEQHNALGLRLTIR